MAIAGAGVSVLDEVLGGERVRVGASMAASCFLGSRVTIHKMDQTRRDGPSAVEGRDLEGQQSGTEGR